jgi:lysophospholipase L1-like esterase
MLGKAILPIGLALLICIGAQGQTPDEVSQAKEHLKVWREKKIPLWMDDFGDLGHFRAANVSLPPARSGENRVVFFGDSITAAWKLDQSFPNKGYINRGIGGQTTSQMLLRFRQDVINLKPKVVVILAGTNDIAGNTGPISLADIEANLATMAELAKLHHVRVVYSSITPVSDDTPSKDMYIERPRSEILELNRWLKDYCATDDLVFLDYFNALVGNDGKLRKGLSVDGLHPNEVAHKIMAPLADAAIGQALGAQSE